MTVGMIKSSCKSSAVWLVPDPEWGWAGKFLHHRRTAAGCPIGTPFRGVPWDNPLWVGSPSMKSVGELVKT